MLLIDIYLLPCALSGPYRPRGAHGFSAILIHFSGKSALFWGKLSDRICPRKGAAELVRSFASFPAERGGNADYRHVYVSCILLSLFVKKDWLATFIIFPRSYAKGNSLFVIAFYSRPWQDSFLWRGEIFWQARRISSLQSPPRRCPSTRPARGDARVWRGCHIN
jgi:hypothetical protein